MLVPDEALSDTMKMTVGMPGMIAVMLGFIVLDPPGPLSLVHSAILHTMYFGATALVWAGILFLCLPGAPSRHGRA